MMKRNPRNVGEHAFYNISAFGANESSKLLMQHHQARKPRLAIIILDYGVKFAPESHKGRAKFHYMMTFERQTRPKISKW